MSEEEVELPGQAGADAGDDNDDLGITLLQDTDDSGTDDSSDSDEKNLTKAQKKARREKRKAEREARKLSIQDKWNKAGFQKPRGKCEFSQEFPTEGGKVILREFEGAQACNGAVIYEGFPSKGLSGVLVAKTLVDELKLPLVGELAAVGFSAACRLRHGVASHVSRIYGNATLVVFVSELQPDSTSCHAISDAIVAWARRRQSKLIITSEGLPDDIKVEFDEDEEPDQAMIVKRLIETMHLDDDTANGDKKRHAAHRRRQRRHQLVSGDGAKKKPTDEADKEDEDGWEDDTDDADATVKPKLSKEQKEKLTGKTMFACTAEEHYRKLIAIGCDHIKNAIITGISGIILTDAPILNPGLEVVLIVARYHPLLGDARAALAIIDAMKAICDVACNVKFSSLKSKASSVEFRVRKGLGKMESGSAAGGKPPQHMYT